MPKPSLGKSSQMLYLEGVVALGATTTKTSKLFVIKQVGVSILSTRTNIVSPGAGIV
ncbi:MAG: Uncharacterised protein [Flavobacteriaceae bacterium]|nr:MAG: Uncharacterised protein [Flavobacteriaceae bacterium]